MPGQPRQAAACTSIVWSETERPLIRGHGRPAASQPFECDSAETLDVGLFASCEAHFKTVTHSQHFTSEALKSEFVGVFDVTHRTLANVLGFGCGAQVALPVVVSFGL